ncbi:MAG TPA: hypothetical protein VNC39_09475 [Acidocella sp.]|jgi:hypothetical protein|uniref:hypothetical protein n=1 Tax=Acidocella sp. TaxID=50710 RepID=UPI002BADBC5D|nr:hypothetical protein [Acidocella sp.]HVE22197.1 hypothetical protein [Acidocella sp.]
MTISLKILPALALAIALSPLAAQAAPQQTQFNGQVIVQSGSVTPAYPASTGG